MQKLNMFTGEATAGMVRRKCELEKADGQTGITVWNINICWEGHKN